ncbi:gliding motility protein GldB-related protein [Dyadobacter sandarakinus]|uniref:Gliding motility protein n=1 Tax=Dyadobacter sandarakinus TaxID=2747268 RepID=A0ABX7IBF1_9BACT|nr:gliding motility protein [Dyadobacter sandarakinus]QRR03043.1 gliding motility protein [Dyadobacter sandarakinus]
MSIRFLQFAWLILLILALGSCQTDQKSEAAMEDVEVNVNYQNLDTVLYACKSVAEVQNFLDKHPHLGKVYFAHAPVPPNQLAQHLFGIMQNPGFRQFASQLDSLIGDREANIIRPFTNAFKHVKSYYPNFQAPRIELIATGFTGDDLYISDSLMIVGLDYFGGPAALYRPNVFDYQLRRYQKEYIVPSAMFFVSDRYNRLDPADRTLLADMVAYGKGYEFVKQVMPDTPDSLIVGYSEENLKRTYNSQRDIWAYLVSSKLIYENSDLKKRKFIEERPFTTEIGEKVPGAIGRWVGWRIVSKYMAGHPDVKLPELMQMEKPALLLQESGYNGELDEEE